MHAGYGIGAMFSVQLLKPFLKFNANLEHKTENSTILNSSIKITSNDIDLQIPYSIASIFGVVTSFTFVIAQYFEMKQIKMTEKSYSEIISIKISNNNNKENYFFGASF